MTEEDPYAIDWVDITIIVLYFIIVLGVGFWASCRAQTGSATGYFLAGRSQSWIPIGASTFATNIGAPMFVGIAGSAAASGIGVIMFEWHAMLMLILLGWLFLPVYLSSGCYTMPQYLKYRFGGQRIRVWIAIVHTFLTIISQIAGQMYAGALFIQQIFKWNLYASVILILTITALYTVVGGLNAVIWTDTIQTLILIIGSFILAGITLYDIGGFESMREQYMWTAANYTYLDVALNGEDANHSCGMPKDNAFHIFRPADDPDYPWPGMLGGLTILALNAWCTDQICVQRSLSAKNMTHAKAGTLLAAYLKVLPFIFFIIPGMISRVLYPEEVACADPVACEAICDNPSGCTNIAYPLLVLREMPTGIRGIMLAALLAALMSSLTSIFNSSSTLFCMDLWRRCRPKSTEMELMVVGRMWTLFLAVVSVLWLPVLEQVQGSEFWDYSQAIGSYLLPPIVMVFLCGIFWPRCTEEGAFWGLVVGFVVGVIRMSLEWSVAPPDCGTGEENEQFKVVSEVHYLHFAMILFAVSFIVTFCVTFVTKPRTREQLRRVTWWTRNDPDFPLLSHDSAMIHSDDDDEKVDKDKEKKAADSTGIKHFLLKWLCGVDHSVKPESLTPEETLELQKKMTDIGEDPYWKKVLDVNAVICAACCVFLHAFWY